MYVRVKQARSVLIWSLPNLESAFSVGDLLDELTVLSVVLVLTELNFLIENLHQNVFIWLVRFFFFFLITVDFLVLVFPLFLSERENSFNIFQSFFLSL